MKRLASAVRAGRVTQIGSLRQFCAQTPQNPKTGSDYIRNIFEQQPTKFGSKHPLRTHSREPFAKPPESNTPDAQQPDLVLDDYLLHIPVWTEAEIQAIRKQDMSTWHRTPKTFSDKWAYWSFWTLKQVMNLACGQTTSKFGLNKFGESGYLFRVTLLETMAGVPGFVAAMARHMTAMRELRRDHGWIHTLLEEAENERMHLLVLLEYMKPSALFKFLTFASQGIMFAIWGGVYFCNPTLFHRFVGYFEEGAVVSYKEILDEIDAGNLEGFKEPAKPLGRAYWQLSDDATFKDVLGQILADEYHHRLVNHTFADLTIEAKKTGQIPSNPFSAQRHGSLGTAPKQEE